MDYQGDYEDECGENWVRRCYRGEYHSLSHPRAGDSRGRGHYEERRFTEDSVPAIMETSEKPESNSSSSKLQGRNRGDNGGGTLGPAPRASNLSLTVRTAPSRSLCLRTILLFRFTQASIRRTTSFSVLPPFEWRDSGPISYRWTTCTSC